MTSVAQVVGGGGLGLTTGAVGLLMAHLEGTPRHYLYTVETANGTEYSVPVKPDVTVGECLVFSVPRDKANQLYWELDQVRIEASPACLPTPEGEYDATMDRQVDANGNNALHSAIWSGQSKRALRIIEEESVDLNSANRFGATALHLAVAKENATIVRALVDAGASLDTPDSDGATPVMRAAEKGNQGILDLMKNVGAR